MGHGALRQRVMSGKGGHAMHSADLAHVEFNQHSRQTRYMYKQGSIDSKSAITKYQLGQFHIVSPMLSSTTVLYHYHTSTNAIPLQSTAHSHIDYRMEHRYEHIVVTLIAEKTGQMRIKHRPCQKCPGSAKTLVPYTTSTWALLHRKSSIPPSLLHKIPSCTLPLVRPSTQHTSARLQQIDIIHGIILGSTCASFGQLCTRRSGRADATDALSAKLPSCLIAGYVSTDMEHSVTANGFHQVHGPLFPPSSGRQVNEDYITALAAKHLHLNPPPWLSLEAMQQV